MEKSIRREIDNILKETTQFDFPFLQMRKRNELFF